MVYSMALRFLLHQPLMIDSGCRLQQIGVTMRLKPLSACSRHSLVIWILIAQHSLQPESKSGKSRWHRFSAAMPDLQEEPE